MNITIINDCRDENTKGRQCARIASLLNVTPNFVGVNSDIEAAGNIIDILDAVGDSEHILLVNVAPRQGTAKRFKNGTPFGYFKYKKCLIISTIDGYTLSLVKKFSLIETLQVLDLEKIVDTFISESLIDQEDGKELNRTQFRSYNVIPYAALLLSKDAKLPAKSMSISHIKDMPEVIWWVDNFGNAKTSVCVDELSVTPDSQVVTQFGAFPFVKNLRNIEDDAIAVVAGSSGIGSKRFAEIVVQGGSASLRLNISPGNQIY